MSGVPGVISIIFLHLTKTSLSATVVFVCPTFCCISFATAESWCGFAPYVATQSLSAKDLNRSLCARLKQQCQQQVPYKLQLTTEGKGEYE